MEDDRYVWGVARLRVKPPWQRKRQDENKEKEETPRPKEEPRYRIWRGKRVRLKKGEYAGPPPNAVPWYSGVKLELDRKPGKSRGDDPAKHIKKRKRRTRRRKHGKRSDDN